ncbi:hypothetical protein GQR58_030519 [Nymphon striatum]|nr:hypothetical protein GQR58_030519 [Nymphon striatum]
MGISKTAFEEVGGYGSIHPGEDPDLTFRFWEKGYETKLISEAYVFHKRRIDWSKFYNQVKKFGMVRPILNKWHPQTSKPTYWFPTLFCLGFIAAILFVAVGINLMLVNASHDQLGVKLDALGFHFLGMSVSNKKVQIDISKTYKKGNEFYISKIDFEKQIEKQLPSSMKLDGTFPEYVDVICLGTLETLKELDISDFQVVADYQELKNKKSQKLSLILQRKPSKLYN